jgi:FKBP-type peptidyl-prolyl cis-trans isomerase SlyD
MSARRRTRRQTVAPSGGFQIGPGTVVALGYELFDAEDERVEGSEPGAPLVLLFGYGDAAPALERSLQGLGVGATRDLTLDPQDAFGPRDPDAIIEVLRTDLPAEIEPGDELEAERSDGQGIVPLKVLEIRDDVVVLDTNHPLAGQKVRLRVTVEAVRPASPEELASATERLAHPEGDDPGPLLPAERLLRRVRGEPSPDRDEPTRPAEGD